jgi:hypothetical protein
MTNEQKAIVSGSEVRISFACVCGGSTPLVLNNIVGSEELGVNRDTEFKRRARLVLHLSLR